MHRRDLRLRLSEFQLLGSNFNAEYGRTGGGFEIFTTKSGTNQFHGAVFDYFRNNVFDSRGFFSPVTPINRQNEYGVAFGGPLWVPKVYDGRTRTFFHFVYSGFRYDASAANTLISVPPLAFRTGDFSSLVNSKGQPVTIYAPRVGAASVSALGCMQTTMRSFAAHSRSSQSPAFF